MHDLDNKKETGLWINSDIFVCQVDKESIMMASFMSTWHKLELSERKVPHLRKIPP